MWIIKDDSLSLKKEECLNDVHVYSSPTNSVKVDQYSKKLTEKKTKSFGTTVVGDGHGGGGTTVSGLKCLVLLVQKNKNL